VVEVGWGTPAVSIFSILAAFYFINYIDNPWVLCYTVFTVDKKSIVTIKYGKKYEIHQINRNRD
jgi:hypothetical protein